MKKILTFIFLSGLLFAFSKTDTENFIKNFVANKNVNFNAIDYVLQNSQPDFSFPSIKTKQKNTSFKIIVLKKLNLPYTLNVYSKELNKTIEITKEKILSNFKFDIWKITINKEYKDLRIEFDYNNKKDFSTDNFSVIPTSLYVLSRRRNFFTMTVGKLHSPGRYSDVGRSGDIYWFFKNSFGTVYVKDSNESEINFCLNNNWAAVDFDDTPANERQMPCVTLKIYQNTKTGWGGIGGKIKNGKVVKTDGEEGIAPTKKIMW